MTLDPPAPYPFTTQGTSRINWMSAFSGFAVGLVAATFVWVQVLPPSAWGRPKKPIRPNAFV